MPEPHELVHAALASYLDEGELITGWVISMEVATADGKCLMHHTGGGIDGADSPPPWTLLGMTRDAMQTAEWALERTAPDED